MADTIPELLDKVDPDQRRQTDQERLIKAFRKFNTFAGLLQIQVKEGGERVNLRLSPIQKRFAANRTGRDIVLKARQIWMTTSECARSVQWFLTKRGARVVTTVQSSKEDAALKDVSYKVKMYFDSLRALGVQIKFGTEAATEWTLPETDSTFRIVGSGASETSANKKGRGGTVNRLHMSEVAFYEHAAETYNSLIESVPMHGSEVVIESTPNGAAGFFFDQWQKATHGVTRYRPHFFPWYEHIQYVEPLEPGEVITPATDLERALMANGVAPERIKWMRVKIMDKGGDLEKFAQEYPSDPETCFLVSGSCFFDKARLNADASKANAPIQRDAHDALWIWKLPEKGHEYVIAADPSEGVGGDACAGIILDRETAEHVATIHGQFIPEQFAKILAYAGAKYNYATVAVERNNHGHAVLMALQRMFNYRDVYIHSDGKAGWPTNEVTRTPALDQLDASHRRGTFTTPDIRLIGEMRTFVVNERGKPEASKSAHDDLVMAASIAWSVRNRPKKRLGLSLLDA